MLTEVFLPGPLGLISYFGHPSGMVSEFLISILISFAIVLWGGIGSCLLRGNVILMLYFVVSRDILLFLEGIISLLDN